MAVEFNDRQAERYLRDVLQLGPLDGRIVWAVSEDEKSLFERILESRGYGGKVSVRVG